MRHNETGAAQRAANVSRIPIINGGDGKGEHPTQALLDMYTIWEKFGRLDHLTVSIGGDLTNGRTGRSLAKILSIYEGNKIKFAANSPYTVATNATAIPAPNLDGSERFCIT
jgi:aspartate carbamoyltransferase catalytic subunit